MSDPMDYSVGWICTSSYDYAAAPVLLDKVHPKPSYISRADNNHYTLGRMGQHNVVITVLPTNGPDCVPAAHVATSMQRSFPNIKFGLVVGTAGGAPNNKHDIRLGDVVIGAPLDGDSGVFQYDFGKAHQVGEFEHTKVINPPPMILQRGHRLEESIEVILNQYLDLQMEYKRPGRDSDLLYLSHVAHPFEDRSSCVESCGRDQSNLVPRRKRSKKHIRHIHFGLIASGNTICRDAKFRDKYSASKGVLCFENAAAGIANCLPCLVVFGISNYADTHANKEWEGYTAMVAAAYAKDLLRYAPLANARALETLQPVMYSLSSKTKYVGGSTTLICLYSFNISVNS
ncbi:hypothetical protein Focb16_v011143 [Fusarium oxysporum f. sp. cubense]|uniref:Nucleoside phosphorylase domain-containing protein n=1 Tax=Fusarium oxysporum f. sp. cubense TaxID=61366 RepID=A0A559L064_FUSOC|nr:hypothetical protein Focb16_v011143 [Fusarium oxysporum f. sp. cubense]